MAVRRYRTSPTPGGVHPWEAESLLSVGRPTRRSVGGRVGEPGDRASKRRCSGEPTQSDHADGHDGVPNNVGLEPPFPPGSKSSARSHRSHAREPGDLEGAGTSMVDGRHRREGKSRNPQQSFEESDARTVPTCKKSANSRVTPEESMEGKRAANGKLAPRNAPRAQDRQGALTVLERVGQRAK